MQWNEEGQSPYSETYLTDKTSLTQIFLGVVQKHGHKTALSTGTKTLSYEKLNQKSNQVAHLLCQAGINREDIIAIFVDKTMDSIVSILGILKAGAAYMPVDPLLPSSRVEYMLRNGKVKFVMNTELAASETKAYIKQLEIREVFTDELERYPEADIDQRKDNNMLAYVMFTSGSESDPKGVMIEDRGIIRLVADEDYFPFHSDWNVLQSSTLVFDASVFEVYGALLNGATLHLIDNDTLLDVAKLKQQLEKQPIDMMFLTTPLFHQLVNIDVGVFDHIHNLVVGGDVLFAKQARLLKDRHGRIGLFNGYGPTENTTFSTFYEVPATVSENVPIGHAISHSTAYIFDTQKKPVSQGETGELYVGGEGVGRGYINDAELTRMKFILHPETGERLYRTGDLARWRKDGNIEFIGRADSQIKFRGFRIELQEVQTIINGLPVVKECAVFCEEDGGEKTLAVYLVLSERVESEALRDQLQSALPDYMLPSKIQILDRLPLNLNGKIDKSQLVCAQQGPTEEPEQASEDCMVVSVLTQQLKKRVLLNNNLYELGFNSITAIRILSELKKQGYTVGIKEILKVKTVQELVDAVEQKQFQQL